MPDVMLTGAGFEMGRVVTQIFGAIRRNIVPIILLCTIASTMEDGASYLGSLYFSDNANVEPTPAQRVWLMLVPLYFIIGVAMKAVLLGSVIYILVEDIDGRQARLAPTMLFGVRMMVPVFVLTLLINLGVAVGLLLLIVPGLMLLMRWLVAVPVRVIEGPGFRNALSRSAALTEGYRWKLFGLAVAYSVLVGVLSLLSNALAGAFATQGTGLAVSNSGAFVLNLVVSVVTSAILIVGIATIYGELRRVKEGGLPNQLAAVFE